MVTRTMRRRKMRQRTRTMSRKILEKMMRGQRLLPKRRNARARGRQEPQLPPVVQMPSSRGKPYGQQSQMVRGCRQ